MAEFPALPLWTDAYLADTRHLSTVQHGAYLLLLMEAWRRPNTELPDDDDLLARLAGLSASEWQMHRGVIMSLWTLNSRSKTWTQKRLTDEKAFVVKRGKKQRSNAKARWNKEKEASHGNAKPDAKSLPNASQTDAPTPTPTPTPTSPPYGGDGAARQRELFKHVESTLFAVDGVKGTNLELAPLNDVMQLVNDGFDLDTEIIPVLRGDLARSTNQSRRRMSWTPIVNRVRENRERSQRNAAERSTGHTPIIPAQPWEKRMKFARDNQAWDSAWGPYPNQPGCLVPSNLVRPNDGLGWIEWSEKARA